MWRIEFDSAKFLPFLPEQSQGNPGVYGFELAAWLAQSLAARGIVTSYPLQEDWGWLLEYVQQRAQILVGCSSVCLEDDGYAGQPITWSIFVDSRKKGEAIEAATQALATQITTLLEAEAIRWRVV